MMIDTPQKRRMYIAAVMARANHHGGNVTKAVKMLDILVDRYGYDLQISDRQGGKIGNVSWFLSKATHRPYYFRYTHADGGSIELLRTNCNGSLFARFTNKTSLEYAHDIFETI